MSYDLSFASVDGSRLTEAAFLTYFGDRRWYSLNGRQAWYSNDDTGVYFSFEYEEQVEPPEDWAELADEGEQWQPTTASFNINYNRPSFFGSEAAPELSAFTNHFQLIVDDPQVDGMGRGPFSEDRFLAGWNKGNRWASSSVRQHASADDPQIYPRERLLAIWRWNFGRQKRQDSVGEKLFVPKISFAVYAGSVCSFCVWPDAIPIFLPRVEHVMIIRDELATKRWFRKHEHEVLLAPWSAIDEALNGFARSEEPLEFIRLEYETAPSHVLQLAKRNWQVVPKDTFKGISPDTVLDAEFFAGASPSNSA